MDSRWGCVLWFVDASDGRGVAVVKCLRLGGFVGAVVCCDFPLQDAQMNGKAAFVGERLLRKARAPLRVLETTLRRMLSEREIGFVLIRARYCVLINGNNP